MGLVQRPQERVRSSRGRRAISVRATEVLLYFVGLFNRSMRSVSCKSEDSFLHFLINSPDLFLIAAAVGNPGFRGISTFLVL